jgi:hypothetical protein
MSFLPREVYEAIEDARLRSLPPTSRRAPAALPSVEVRLPEVSRRPLSLTAFLSDTSSSASTETLHHPMRGTPAPLPVADCEIPKLNVKQPGRTL